MFVRKGPETAARAVQSCYRFAPLVIRRLFVRLGVILTGNEEPPRPQFLYYKNTTWHFSSINAGSIFVTIAAGIIVAVALAIYLILVLVPAGTFGSIQ
jgi:hypothetical protein